MTERMQRGRFIPTSRSKNIEYAIRDIIVHAKKLGKDVLYLNIGDPVRFGFNTPEHVKETLVKAVKSNANYYADSEGLESLREAIAKRERNVNSSSIEKDDVIVTNGVSEGISMVMGALIESGDEILVPGPSYQPYVAYIKFFGGVPVEYKNIEGRRWQPDTDDLRAKITPKTKAILVISPNNPTGACYNEPAMREIVATAQEHNLLILTDEIYDEIIYENRNPSISSLSRETPLIGLNGFSKSSLMTGWRLGYLYFKAQNGELDALKESVAKQARIRISANLPVQMAALAALEGPRDYVSKMVLELRQRRDYSLKRLVSIERLSAERPDGAFYLFPKVDNLEKTWSNDTEFVLDFLKTEAVLLVPGSGFGTMYGSGHFRMVFLPTVDILTVAFDRLEDFMSKRRLL